MTRRRRIVDTRAVTRYTQPGSIDLCTHCGKAIKFRARLKVRHVICNVYGGRPRKWRRVELFHEDCYEEAGRPHGDAPSKDEGPFAERTAK